MNRPPMLPGSSGSVPSPIQHHSPMPQHAIPARPMMSQSMSQQLGPGMSPAMVQMMAQQQSQPSQTVPMMPQQQMPIPPLQQQQQMPIPPQPLPAQAISKQYLCRVGADIVQDIVSKTLELFQHLRSMTPHFTSSNQQCEDKKNKIKDTIKYIETLFKKLRKIYETCNEVCPSIDYVDPKSLLPLKEEEDSEEDKDKIEDGMDDDPKSVPPSVGSIKNEEKKSNPKYQQLEKDYNDLVELNKLKNRQLKEIIDRIRKLVWDINTMLAMRRP